ncbi:MAG: sporulation protein YunB [Clostridia bacterium]|nr:sporulation protein YunB [Clostridia bacterium]
MKKSKKKLKLFSFTVSVIMLSCFLYFSSNRILENLALESFDSLISSASYNAINKILVDGYDYKSLIDVSTNSQGEIVMITTDSVKVTSMASLAATNTYNYLKNYTNCGVDVPIGAFTGIKLISGFGKTVKMRLIAVSSVNCEIVSSFTDAGINQTRHTITINIVSTVTLVTKTSNKVVSDKISILVYDNLIIGKVPEVYLNSQVIGNADKN